MFGLRVDMPNIKI